MQTLQCFICILGYTGRISQEQNQKNEGVRRQRLHALQHLIKRQIIKPDEVHAIGKRLKPLAKCLGPILLERCRPDNDRDVFRVGRYLQNVFGEAPDFVIGADKGRILVESVGSQKTSVEAAIKDGNVEKKTMPKFGDKNAGWAANGNHQIRLPVSTALFQVVNQGLLHVRCSVSRHVQGNFVQINTVPHSLYQLRFKGC